MALAEVSTTILDGALGLSPQDLTAYSAAVGVASTGAVNTMALYSRGRDVKAALTTGPLVEKGCYHIERSKKPLYLMRLTSSVAGTAGAIAKSNASSPTITQTGAPKDSYTIVLEITQDAEIGDDSADGAFRYTVDGGDSYTVEYAMPAGEPFTSATVSGTVDLSLLDYANAAVVTGSGDLSVGGLYGGGGTLDGLTVIADINNAGSLTCTFTPAPANKAALVSALNTTFGGTHFSAPGNFLVINSTTIGGLGEIDIIGGTALVALGLDVDITNGDPGDLDGATVEVDIDNAGAETCTFGAPADQTAVLVALNAAIGSGTDFTAPDDLLVITSPTTGLTSEVDVVAGTGLATLGLVVDVVNGEEAGAAGYALGDTGIQLTFPVGTYTAGDTYSWSTTEPNYSLANLQAGLDVMLADAQKTWFVCHVVGSAATASAARAMADLLDTYASDAEALHRFTWFAMETPAAASKADLLAQFASFESRRVGVSYGHCELTSEATRDTQKRVYSRPAMWPYVMRLASVDISEKAAFVGRGKLAGVVSVTQAVLDDASEMEAARFVCLREVIGKSGYFIAEDSMMSPLGSDFAIAPYRRIMDVACGTVRAKLLNYLQGKILVDPTTGFILESVAKAIEDDCNDALNTTLVAKGHATSALVVIARDENILSQQGFSVETRVVPPGYGKTISHTIGFINPTVTQN